MLLIFYVLSFCGQADYSNLVTCASDANLKTVMNQIADTEGQGRHFSNAQAQRDTTKALLIDAMNAAVGSDNVEIQEFETYVYYESENGFLWRECPLDSDHFEDDGENYTTPKESAQGCETVTGHNIIGKIPGSSGEKKVVVFSSHWDSVIDSPAAYDNMAACEVNMAIASALKNSAPLYDIHFALTDLEENGLCLYKNHGMNAWTSPTATIPEMNGEFCGSALYAEKLKQDGYEVIVNMNFDSIGLWSDVPGTRDAMMVQMLGLEAGGERLTTLAEGGWKLDMEIVSPMSDAAFEFGNSFESIWKSVNPPEQRIGVWACTQSGGTCSTEDGTWESNMYRSDQVSFYKRNWPAINLHNIPPTSKVGENGQPASKVQYHDVSDMARYVSKDIMYSYVKAGTIFAGTHAEASVLACGDTGNTTDEPNTGSSTQNPDNSSANLITIAAGLAILLRL